MMDLAYILVVVLSLVTCLHVSYSRWMQGYGELTVTSECLSGERCSFGVIDDF